MKTLADKISQRDLDAFRAGIEEQVRGEVELEQIQASFDRCLNREHSDQARLLLIPARELRSGDVLVGVEDGTSFYRDNRLERVSSNGDRVWAEWGEVHETDPFTERGTIRATPALVCVAGGGGGKAFRGDETVLVERGDDS